MDSVVSHINVSFIEDGKKSRSVSLDYDLIDKGEPKGIEPVSVSLKSNASPLDQKQFTSRTV